MSTATAAFKRVLPGLAWRNSDSEVIFVNGWVHFMNWGLTGPISQTVETDSKIVPVIKLIDATFAYWCENCRCTVFEEEVQTLGRINAKLAEDEGRVLPPRSFQAAGQVCPFCGLRGPRIFRPLAHGDRVRCHYRFAKDGKWGTWWAERYDW